MRGLPGLSRGGVYHRAGAQRQRRNAHGVSEVKTGAQASPREGFHLVPAISGRAIDQVRELFLEYASSLGFSLCFQNFDRELAELPGDYVAPAGGLWLLTSTDQAAGCVALHQIGPQVSEMKRLYVRPQFRGCGLGRILAERAIQDARQMGHLRLRLDTVEPAMKTAVALYRKLGFREIPPYRANPIAGALYMEFEIRKEEK